MKLNCKQGDVAWIVRASNPANLGKVVKCVTLLPAHLWNAPGGREYVAPGWVVDRPITTWSGQISNHVPDHQLRPIRDPGDDAVDETLSWSTPGQRSQRDADRCKRLVDEVCGVTQ